MSQAAALAPHPYERTIEQIVFTRSPFGTVPTAVLIFVLLTASFAAMVELSHQHLFHFDSLWPATVVSLLIAAALGLQRYVREKRKDEAQEFASVFVEIDATADSHAGYRRALLVATGLGIAAGLATSTAFFPSGKVAITPPLEFWWFVTMSAVLATLLARGMVQTRFNARAFSRLIEHGLRIDLLRVDKLSVIGRHCARNAFVWFAVSALICLFFVGGNMGWMSFAVLAFCASTGIWIFVSPMERVHRRIRATKAQELERLRAQIDGLRHAAGADASAAQRLQGLLAYESRIAAAPEWPFDQTTLVRVVASAFILTVPWFGQAIAAFAVERFTDIVK